MKTNNQKIYSEIQKGYDKAAEHFSRTRWGFWKDLEFIKQFIPKNVKLLDFGCGNGRLIEFLKDKQLNYLGVDVSQNLIATAQKKYPKVQFQVISPDPLAQNGLSSLKKESFDIVISISVFHHFPPSEQRNEILKQLKRILKPDGLLIITVWNLYQKKYEKYFGENKEGSIPFKDSDGKILFNRYHYRWGREELEKFIENEGFEKIRSGYSERGSEKVNLYWIGRKS